MRGVLALLVLGLLLAPSAMAQTANNTTVADSKFVEGDGLILHRWDNPLPDPFDGAWGTFALNILIWAAISIAAIFVVGPFLHFVARRVPGDLDDHIVQILRTPGFLILFAFGAVDSLRSVRTPVWLDTLAETLWDTLVIIAVTIMVYRLWKEVILGIGKKLSEQTESSLDDRLYPFFAKVGGVVIIIVGLFYLVGSFGVDLAVFAAGGAFLSLVIAFAAQDTLGNFFAGVFLLLDQPFREGDRIELTEFDTWGDVSQIGLRSTRIRTRDNRLVIFPNATIANNPVINHSFPDPMHRIGVDVGIAYGSDIETARQVMIDAVKGIEGVVQDKRVEALFLKFGESSLEFHVRAFFVHYIDKRRYTDKLNTVLHKALADAGIEIPFPQRVVHLKQTEKHDAAPSKLDASPVDDSEVVMDPEDVEAERKRNENQAKDAAKDE